MHLLAGGVFVSLPPLGLVVARKLVAVHARDSIALALPLAVALWSIPLASFAVAGHFDARLVGAMGWLTTALALVVLARPGMRDAVREMRAAGATDWRAFAVLGVAAVIYALAVVESPIGSRDEGLYTLSGLALDRVGSVAIAAPDTLARASHLFEPFVSGIPFHLPGIPAGAKLRPQFFPLLPAWIAQLHATAGDAALYRINLLFALASGALFHAVARRMLRPALALLALAAFSLEPAQVWSARINLAEPLGMLFGLAGLLLVVEHARRPARPTLLWATALLSLAVLARLDAIVVAPLLTLAAGASALWQRDRRRSEAMLAAGAFVLAGQWLAIIALAIFSPPYVGDNLSFLLVATAMSGAGFLGYSLVRAGAFAPLARPGARRIVAPALCVALALAFAYAWLVRPHAAPFAVIGDRGSVLAGMRDYREESLLDVAAYLGWPCMFLALVGAMFAVRRVVRGTAGAATLVVSLLAIGTGFAYLAAPHVSPDHPWAVRRMVMLVFPLFILLAGYGTQSVLHLAAGWGARRVPGYAIVALAIWLLVQQRTTLAFTENGGLTAQLRTIDDALPRGRLIVRDLEGLATTLALGFGRDVLPLRDESVAVDAASRAFWSSCRTRRCTLLHLDFGGLDGLVLTPATGMAFSRDFLAPTVHPLAQARTHRTTRFLVSRILGIAGRAPPTNAGSARDWRVADRGFYREEIASGATARWTRGDADIQLPATGAERIELRLASAAPDAQTVAIGIDGRIVFHGDLARGESRFVYPLDASASAGHRVTLESATFVPGGAPGARDNRTLGVSVRAIRLLRGDPPMLSAQSPPGDFRSALLVRRILPMDEDARRTATFRADIENLGGATWPTGAATGQGVVRLGLSWARAGEAERVAEQRLDLPYALRPGEHWTSVLAVNFETDPLRRLAPGRYELRVGLVLDGIAWFAERGDAIVTIPITIPPPRS